MEGLQLIIGGLLGGTEMQGSAHRSDLEALSIRMGVVFPNDYTALMLLANGVEGAIGRNNYIVIWHLEEVPELNQLYEVAEFAPGLLLFGSDGGDSGYGFDTRSDKMEIVDMPLIGMDWNETHNRWPDLLTMLKDLKAK